MQFVLCRPEELEKLKVSEASGSGQSITDDEVAALTLFWAMSEWPWGEWTTVEWTRKLQSQRLGRMDVAAMLHGRMHG